ncbi:uncharacterized protein JN550_012772 [Neoarthrinium moseri]|uniref:uncharacterized protein n=1 Tax=Neoarthrinium moseri TaxID=1658444 RepID=UPI001FDC36DA|nr:uncharacterized protein JN550_012772 [Neoarthrinium moseri]KAI1858322.1 hypothetical protein JN550_012772 [Neoarthrinium moseri]
MDLLEFRNRCAGLHATVEHVRQHDPHVLSTLRGLRFHVWRDCLTKLDVLQRESHALLQVASGVQGSETYTDTLALDMGRIELFISLTRTAIYELYRSYGTVMPFKSPLKPLPFEMEDMYNREAIEHNVPFEECDVLFDELINPDPVNNTQRLEHNSQIGGDHRKGIILRVPPQTWGEKSTSTLEEHALAQPNQHQGNQAPETPSLSYLGMTPPTPAPAISTPRQQPAPTIGNKRKQAELEISSSDVESQPTKIRRGTEEGTATAQGVSHDISATSTILNSPAQWLDKKDTDDATQVSNQPRESPPAHSRAEWRGPHTSPKLATPPLVQQRLAAVKGAASQAPSWYTWPLAHIPAPNLYSGRPVQQTIPHSGLQRGGFISAPLGDDGSSPTPKASNMLGPASQRVPGSIPPWRRHCLRVPWHQAGSATQKSRDVVPPWRRRAPPQTAAQPVGQQIPGRTPPWRLATHQAGIHGHYGPVSAQVLDNMPCLHPTAQRQVCGLHVRSGERSGAPSPEQPPASMMLPCQAGTRKKQQQLLRRGDMATGFPALPQRRITQYFQLSRNQASNVEQGKHAGFQSQPDPAHSQGLGKSQAQLTPAPQGMRHPLPQRPSVVQPPHYYYTQQQR